MTASKEKRTTGLSLIQAQKEEMPRKTGAKLEISRILVHDLQKEREGVDASLLTDRWEDIIEAALADG